MLTHVITQPVKSGQPLPGCSPNHPGTHPLHQPSTYMTKIKHIGLVILCFTLAISSFLVLTAALQRHDGTPAIAIGTPVTLPEVTIEAEDHAVTSEDVLWLARVIYSETSMPHEQELVAWVVRNRVETEYRGRDTYRGVVMDPWQFSAFNLGSSKRQFFMTLTEQSREPGWQKALEIAGEVAQADGDVRPFAKETRHFYSERSMVGRSAPVWANNRQPVKLDRQVDVKRFRFYAGVS